MSDVPNMKTRAFQSIAVVGQLKTGKETICRLLGEKFASRKEEPRRYEITAPGAPRLQGYVLTIYSKLDHLNLDMPERTGIIVLTPEKISSLCAENRFRRHEQFFEMLQKLGWLGVKRYIVVVTHIYETEHHDIGWFETITRQFSHILRKHLGLRIRACVPVGRKNEHYWYNIHCSEPWYSGPCLVKALENLMAGQKQAPDSLWVVGTAIPTEKNNIFRVNAEKPSRGTFCHNSTVHIFFDNPDTPDELEGILKMDAEAEQSAPSSVQLYDRTLQQKSPVVLVSTTTPIQFPAVIKVDALLKDGLTLDELITTDLDVTFFGSYSPHTSQESTEVRPGKTLACCHSHRTRAERRAFPCC